MAKKSSGKDSVREAFTNRAKKMKETVTSQVERTRDQTRVKTVHTAQKLVQLQENTFTSTFKFIAQIQGQCEKAVRDYVESAEWLPQEGKAVVEEWVRTMHKGRVSFQKTVEKSFGLLDEYFARVQAEEQASGAVAKAKGKPAGKEGAKKGGGHKKTATTVKTAKKRSAKKRPAPEAGVPGA